MEEIRHVFGFNVNAENLKKRILTAQSKVANFDR